MAKRSAVILAGGAELTREENVRALTDAGYQVIPVHTLDYALVANELFEPKVVVLDTRQMEGDIDFFCQTLACRPNHPVILLLDDEHYDSRGVPPSDVKRLQNRPSPRELVRRVNKYH